MKWLSRIFVTTVALVLLLTAATKAYGVWEAVGEPAAPLNRPDPLLHFLSRGDLSVIATLLEILVGGALLSCGLTVEHKLFAVLWLGSLLLCYHLGLRQSGFTGTCGCVGHGIAPALKAWLPAAILTYMLGGSVSLLLTKLAFNQKANRAPTRAPLSLSSE